MANKFTNFIFTTEGKDTITQVLAAKKVAANAQLSINTVYTFATKLSTSLVYTQISSLGPKQTKPVGTVTPQDNDTVEMRIQLDNADLTTGYNLQGVAIVGQYNGNNFVLGYINSNETTNIPPYDGTQVQTVALDVSFAISDSNIVTINTQTAGMLTVDDYNALVKLLETRVSPLATDSKVVHLKGNESISDVKRFNETIIGSVDGNAGTADYMNVHTISSDINLDSISSNGNYLSTSKTKTTSGKPNGTSEQYTLVVGGNIQLFNDMSTDALYLRNRIDSKTLTPWKKIVEDVDQTLNAKYNYAQLPTVNGSGVVLQSDLAAESNSRSVADRDLKTSIALEAQTRSAADIAFGSSLAAEVATRSTADASVTAAMTKEQATRSTADASITANLMTETSARSAADTSLKALYSGLNSNLNDEIAARSAADKLILGSTADLDSKITKERDNRVFNDNSLASDLVSEAAKRDELFGSMGEALKDTSNTVAAVNAGAVHKTGDTMTGWLRNTLGFRAGGNPTVGEDGSQVGNSGSIELAASSPYIDFHAKNSTADYTSRIWDLGGGLWVTANGQNNNLTQVLANTGNPINIDTMAGGLPSLTGIGQSVRVQMDNLTPDGTIPPVLSKWSVLTHLATNSGTAWQELWDVVSTSIWRRTRSGYPSAWSSWKQVAMTDSSITGNSATATKLLKPFKLNGKLVDGSQDVQINAANDDQLVHQSGSESIGGPKTFTAGPVISQEAPGLWFATTGSPDGNQQLIRLGSTGTMGENIGYFGTNQLAVFGGGEGAAAIQKDIYSNGHASGDLSFLTSATESGILVADGSAYVITNAQNYQGGTFSGHQIFKLASNGDLSIPGSYIGDQKVKVLDNQRGPYTSHFWVRRAGNVVTVMLNREDDDGGSEWPAWTKSSETAPAWARPDFEVSATVVQNNKNVATIKILPSGQFMTTSSNVSKGYGYRITWTYITSEASS